MTIENAARKFGIALCQIGEALGITNLDPESGLIFVTGGSGVVGHRVATRLLRAGYPSVRLAAHDPKDLADEMNQLGGEIAEFDWENEATYEKALVGVKTVLCTIPYTRHFEKHFPAFLNACLLANVRHFVKLSFYHARVFGDPFQQVPLVWAHGQCDQMLIQKLTPEVVQIGDDITTIGPHMSYTILYASHLMSNPFTFQGHELHSSKTVPVCFYGASGNHGVNYVSPNDVAEVAVRVMLEPRAHYNKEYTLTGPRSIPDQEVASLLSKHLKKAVMYVDQPLKEFSDEIKYGGQPSWIVKDMVALESIKATGSEEKKSFVTNDIERVCGHKAETFEEYLAMHDMMTPIEAGAPDELKPLKTN
jgi:uncharacterized protein YbjT (DUF2867 family)